MREFLRRSAWLGLGMVAVASAAGVACSGGSDTKKTPATATQGAATPSGAAAATVSLIAKNTLFDKSALTAKSGTVTIQVDNQDIGIPHNVHVYKGKDNTGQDMGKSALEAGPVKQTLKLELTAGAYFFVCDVHPATMAGKLTVE